MRDKYFWINLSLVFFMFLTIFVTSKLKHENLKVTQEIEYIQAQIAEQDNLLKLYYSELSLITQPDYLIKLYKAYYKIEYKEEEMRVAKVNNLKFLAEKFALNKKISGL